MDTKKHKYLQNNYSCFFVSIRGAVIHSQSDDTLLSGGRHWFIGLGQPFCFFRRNHFAIEEVNGPIGETCETRIVSHHADRSSFAVQFVKQIHHGHAVLRIEISCWFVGEEDRRAAREGSRDGDTLLLPAGKLR